MCLKKTDRMLKMVDKSELLELAASHRPFFFFILYIIRAESEVYTVEI